MSPINRRMVRRTVSAVSDIFFLSQRPYPDARGDEIPASI
jgi:hypothetical protein